MWQYLNSIGVKIFELLSIRKQTYQGKLIGKYSILDEMWFRFQNFGLTIAPTSGIMKIFFALCGPWCTIELGVIRRETTDNKRQTKRVSIELSIKLSMHKSVSILRAVSIPKRKTWNNPHTSTSG